MIGDVANFFRVFYQSRTICIFPSPLRTLPSVFSRFPFHYPAFRFQFQFEQKLFIDFFRDALSRTKKKPFWRRHLNASEDKDTMSGRFHSQNKKRQRRSRRNERCNLFRRLFFSRARNDVRKK